MVQQEEDIRPASDDEIGLFVDEIYLNHLEAGVLRTASCLDADLFIFIFYFSFMVDDVKCVGFYFRLVSQCSGLS